MTTDAAPACLIREILSRLRRRAHTRCPACPQHPQCPAAHHSIQCPPPHSIPNARLPTDRLTSCACSSSLPRGTCPGSSLGLRRPRLNPLCAPIGQPRGFRGCSPEAVKLGATRRRRRRWRGANRTRGARAPRIRRRPRKPPRTISERKMAAVRPAVSHQAVPARRQVVISRQTR